MEYKRKHKHSKYSETKVLLDQTGEHTYFYSVHGEYLKHSHIHHQMSRRSAFFGVDQNYVQDTKTMQGKSQHRQT